MNLLPLCFDILLAVENAQASLMQTEISNMCNRKIIEVMKLLYKHTDNSNDFKINEARLDEIKECLLKIKSLLERIIYKQENYFCTYKYEIYMVELKSIAIFLKEVILSCESNGGSYSPLVKMFSLISLPSIEIPDIVSRLFWLKYFKNSSEVDWMEYMNCFILEYGAHHEYALNNYKTKLSESKTVSCHESTTIKRHMISVSSFAKFGYKSNPVSVYDAFQSECDPGSVVLMSGLLIEDSDTHPNTSPQIISSLLGLKIASIACGGQHAAVIGEDGSVYTWGRGGFGRLGHGNIDYYEIPYQIASFVGQKIVQITCGFAYTAAVNDIGEVYSWGAGDNGRLGLGDTKDQLVPTLITSLIDEKIVSVHAGSVHTAFLATRGQVFTCGKSEYAGHGTSYDVLTPLIVETLKDVEVTQITVGPGGYHTIVLTNKNEIYSWGHNRVGQLGYVNNPSVPRNVEGAFYLPKPAQIKGIFAEDTSKVITQLVAGWGHSGLLTSDGTPYLCGRNIVGQLGLGDPNNFPKNERGHPYQPTFAPVSSFEDKKITQIACGGEHTIFITQDQEVYACGSGGKGQLGLGDRDDRHEPCLLTSLRISGRSIHQVKCGNQCTILLTGKFHPVSLQQRCMDTIRMNSINIDENYNSSYDTNIKHDKY